MLQVLSLCYVALQKQGSSARFVSADSQTLPGMYGRGTDRFGY